MAETSTSRPLEILDWSGAGRFGDVLDLAAHAYALALLTGFRGLSLILVGPTLRPDIGLHEPGGGQVELRQLSVLEP